MLLTFLNAPVASGGRSRLALSGVAFTAIMIAVSAIHDSYIAGFPVTIPIIIYRKAIRIEYQSKGFAAA